ncbi:SusC/RagA family TonB-linked outer membrane protein [Polaribacter glomeratus]|uniref:SusC/RagA family protein n=1 Tax=Polaribacter glomeratus TaxID=102 RepID=A0A2S7WG84_9FLAO|nr:TonB-dependent receptor [Polaribacter glomeratus]PQJ76614.1 SusC/RagA family protein [Polaribacter glomeratus]TXD67548.1 TonB-dependent receptor [Polaribacter glomeratus]
MSQNNSIKKISTCLFLLASLFAFSQQKVTGKVTDGNSKFGLPTVTIQVKGTSNGTTSDFDGNYTITVSNADAILVFSYLGYASQEVKINKRSIINISLAENENLLNEIVVVGYGSVKKSDITGAVSSVKSEELNAFPVLDAAQALQGRAAGVSVQSNNGGEPGTPISVKIRGNTSIGASSSALIVVDGFVGANMPQANDIESLEVLKDASATAIYGSRGSNGVILVTTKKGKKGRLSVELNSTYSAQTTSERLDLLNADQFGDYQTAINPAYVRGTANTDWQDLIYKTGSTANHQLSFSGGTDKVNFYASGTYFDQDGVVLNSGFNRTSFLSNIDAQITDKLKLGFNAFGSRSEKQGISTQADTGGRGSGDVVSIAFRFSPDLGLFNANGSNSVDFLRDGIDNPVAVAKESIDETKTDNYRANFYANYDLLENLTFKTTFGFSTINETRGTYKPSTLELTAGQQGGIGAIANARMTNVLSENYLTYTKDLDKSKLTLLAGYSYQKNTTERSSAGAQGFTSDSFSYYNLGGGATPLPPASSLTETEILSQFGRLNYDYNDKYLLTLTARRDGASNFAANEKYAFFPSGAFGWKVSNEEFIKNIEQISNLKLRVSYGVTGNPSISPYQSLASFNNIYAAVGGQTVNAVVPNQSANPTLKWESSYQSNFGIDLGLFNSKISLSLDYYNIDTKDVILGDTGQPEYFGFLNNQSLKNIGEINNKGLEISLSTKNISTDNFSWKTDFNWSKNRNKMVTLIGGEDVFLNAAPGHFLRDETHLLREGEAVGVFWGYDYQGVYQGGALPTGTGTLTANAAPGDELFTDIDGDGKITSSDDRKIIGDPNQDWTMGITNTFTYKNIDLNIFFQGAYGGDIMSLTHLELANGNSNSTTEVLNAWTPSNTNTNVPSAKVRANDISSRFVYDGSYIRLKNIALGYTLPSDITKKLGMDNVRLSVSGQNLLTFTDYPGLDPEVSYKASGSQNSNVNQGFDYGNYPNIQSVSFSLNLKF